MKSPNKLTAKLLYQIIESEIALMRPWKNLNAKAKNGLSADCPEN